MIVDLKGEPTVDDSPKSSLSTMPESRLLTPTEIADRLGVSVPAVVTFTVCLIAALIGGWWALRPPAQGIDPEDILPSANTVSKAAVVPENSSVPPDTILVHVAGAVARPGVHEILSSSRVVDAITAAGGPSTNADIDQLNLAEPLSDGARLWVPEIGETDSPEVLVVTSSAAGRTPTGRNQRVNINTAGIAVLQTLPGVGPSLAAAIVEHRERFGLFGDVDELDDVAGIGPAKLEKLRPLVGV